MRTRATQEARGRTWARVGATAVGAAVLLATPIGATTAFASSAPPPPQAQQPGPRPAGPPPPPPRAVTTMVAVALLPGREQESAGVGPARTAVLHLGGTEQLT